MKGSRLWKLSDSGSDAICDRLILYIQAASDANASILRHVFVFHNMVRRVFHQGCL
jgi:hypothetical protein